MEPPTANIMLKLYISEGTFNRTRRMAIRSLARALGEMETSVFLEFFRQSKRE